MNANQFKVAEQQNGVGVLRTLASNQRKPRLGLGDE